MADGGDYTGRRFGRLTVLECAGKNKHHDTVWKCLCDCGTETVVAGYRLKNGHTQSCGCLTKETARERNRTHGGRHTRLYSVWAHMKERCNNSNSISYPNYGGRGIAVCDEWQQDFSVFRDWAICHGYTDELEIDRIDNDGGYCPENCRWATKRAQSYNRRSNRYLEYNGKRQTIKEWALEIGISPKVLYDRVKSGWDVERVLTEPKKGEAHG